MKLIHAVPVLKPNYPESDIVINEMTGWFKNC